MDDDGAGGEAGAGGAVDEDVRDVEAVEGVREEEAGGAGAGDEDGEECGGRGGDGVWGDSHGACRGRERWFGKRGLESPLCEVGIYRSCPRQEMQINDRDAGIAVSRLELSQRTHKSDSAPNTQRTGFLIQKGPAKKRVRQKPRI